MRGQEGDELGQRHLARGHRELAMLDFAKAAATSFSVLKS
jgi:hypothetical protein